METLLLGGRAERLPSTNRRYTHRSYRSAPTSQALCGQGWRDPASNIDVAIRIRSTYRTVKRGRGLAGLRSQIGHGI